MFFCAAAVCEDQRGIEEDEVPSTEEEYQASSGTTTTKSEDEELETEGSEEHGMKIGGKGTGSLRIPCVCSVQL